MAVGSLTQADASPGIVAVGDELQSLAARLGIAWAPIRPEHGLALLETPKVWPSPAIQCATAIPCRSTSSAARPRIAVASAAGVVSW